MSGLCQVERVVLSSLEFDARRVRSGEPIDMAAIEVSARHLTGSGLLVDLVPNSGSRLYSEGLSFRAGEDFVVTSGDGDVLGFVVYVDRGYVSALEVYTFGGGDFPKDLDARYVLRKAGEAPV